MQSIEINGEELEVILILRSLRQATRERFLRMLRNLQGGMETIK
jgi:hypothetical protein